MFHFRQNLLNTLKRFKLHIDNRLSVKNMSCTAKSENETSLLEECKAMIPSMGHEHYKGQAGRIGIIGGSLDYTGAPYFAAISALKVGCDLSHVFCAKEAAPVIKSYSPELIVHPVLDSNNALELIKPWMPRLHSLVIGPGLGRDPQILETVAKIIDYCRNEAEEKKPLVIDADGLFLLAEKPNVIKDYPFGAIITPNAVEFGRLALAVLGESWNENPNIGEVLKQLAVALGEKIVVVLKGNVDMIASGDKNSDFETCSIGGSGRRCGGQGDLLSGSLGTFYYWSTRKGANVSKRYPNGVIAAYAGCALTKICNEKAVAKTGRSTLTTDMVNEIHSSFTEIFGN